MIKEYILTDAHKSQRSEPTKEANKNAAIIHQILAADFRDEIDNPNYNYQRSESEWYAAKHYAAARTYMGIKDKDQFYA